MSIDRIVLAFAGAMIGLSLVLAQVLSPAWLWLTAFVGLNLFQSAFTGFCPLALVLKKLGVAPGAAFR
ncbi:MAG: DUF2892 domain-containing protein [Candidatus Sericytochromatia bacterium]|nr:DUF2892 domain-containing protein [Candidatus Sericytochromatia bacterium]